MDLNVSKSMSCPFKDVRAGNLTWPTTCWATCSRPPAAVPPGIISPVGPLDPNF